MDQDEIGQIFERFDEKRLGELVEALKASAIHKGYSFVDPNADLEGLIPETPIQAHPAGPLIDFQGDELPADARFLLWADYTIDAGEIHVRAGEVDLGTWTEDEFQEVFARYQRATG